MRVAVGAVAKKLLAALDIDVHGFVTNICPASSDLPQLTQYKTLTELRAITESLPTRALTVAEDEAMREVIEQAKRNRHTVGRTVQVMATRVPAGLVSYVSADEKLDAYIARAMVGINAFKVVE